MGQIDLGGEGGARMRSQFFEEQINQHFSLAILLLAASEDLKEQRV